MRGYVVYHPDEQPLAWWESFAPNKVEAVGKFLALAQKTHGGKPWSAWRERGWSVRVASLNVGPSPHY